MSSQAPTQQRAEAEALARALDGAAPETAPPPEALEAAALLRHAKSEGALDPARLQALGAKLRAEVRPPRRRRWWIWILPPLAVGAAVLLLVPRTRPPLTLPTPAASLLAAQAEAARGNGEALASLDEQMRSYRRALYERLQRSGR